MPVPRHAAAPTGGIDDHVSAARAIASGELSDELVRSRLRTIDAREDLADHAMVVVLKFLLEAPDELPDELRAEMERSVLGFRYWMDEPGTDSMCHWSESHQLLFSVCEHLAGQLFGDKTFTNDGRKGHRKAERGRERLLEWLGNRFRYGFSEWLSHTYYALDVAGLVLLVDHTDDEDLRTRAAMVLDLLLLDMALHRFEGRFVASAGRANAVQKARPDRAEVNTILAAAFGPQPAFDPDQLSSLFVARRRYRVPRVVREIARAQSDHLVTCSQGLDSREVPWELARRRGLDPKQRRDQLVNLFWSMEAFTTPESIGPTIEAIQRLHLSHNRFIAPLLPLARMRSAKVLSAAVRALNPVTQGIAMQRANVTTYRTPHYLLSSAQHYQVGRFGDQEHIWHAALPGDISVFSTHPGTTRVSGSVRPSTPSAWVGNGINPDVAQHRNVLLALHDVRTRHGYLEGRRHELSHLYFPSVRFDEFSIGDDFVAGRRGDSFIGVLALNPVEMVNESEIIQRGNVTGWAVVVADRGDYGSLGRLVDHLKRCRVRFVRESLVVTTPEHEYVLPWGGELSVDGVLEETFHPRLHCEWAHVPRHASLVQVEGRTGSLVLDWKMGIRTERTA